MREEKKDRQIKQKLAKKANEKGRVTGTTKTITGRLFKEIYAGFGQETMKKVKNRIEEKVCGDISENNSHGENNKMKYTSRIGNISKIAN